MINQNRFRPFRRLPTVAWVGGICAGIAYSIGAPTWVIRLLWVILTISGMGSGILMYVLLWVFVPTLRITPPDYYQRTGDRGVV